MRADDRRQSFARARVLAALLPIACAASLGACSWDLGKLFDRDDPGVERARHELEASISGSDADLQAAQLALEEVLQYRCEADGGRDLVVERPGAAIDLGLVVFRVSELIGRRFGEEEAMDAAGEEADGIAAGRARELDCAHLLLGKLAGDPATPHDLALRARYLLGNFEFLSRNYKEAIADYDRVLLQHPARGIDPVGEVGPPSDDDAVARDAAWNRAIALKRLDEQNDAGSDSDAPDSQDSGSDSQDSGSDSSDSGGDGGDSGAPDSGGDSGDDANADSSPGDSGGADSGGDTGSKPQPDSGAPRDAGAPPPSPSSVGSVDLRELNRFDKQAPIDFDLAERLRERKKIPKELDK